MAVSDEGVSRRSLLKKAGAGAIVLTAGGIMTSSASANQALDVCIGQALDDSVAACGACANQAACGEAVGASPRSTDAASATRASRVTVRFRAGTTSTARQAGSALQPRAAGRPGSACRRAAPLQQRAAERCRLRAKPDDALDVGRGPPREALSRCVLRLQVDDDVGDRHREPLARRVHHSSLQPVGPALRVCGDDHLVGAERP